MSKSEHSLALLHHQFGPYHFARARTLRQQFPGTVHFVQLADSEALRDWRASDPDLGLLTASSGVLESLPPGEVARGLEEILRRIDPAVIAVAGYAHLAMRRAAIWARQRGARTILMSDSQVRDRPRRAGLEWIKKRWISRHFDAAFVAGASASFYAEAMGIPPHRIWRGYDVVDNDYFERNAAAAREQEQAVRQKLELPKRFFLYVGRFSPEKNLPWLIESFRRVAADPRIDSLDLVLVGGGPLEEDLRKQARPLGQRIQFRGFQQIEALPSFYALASALILPSLSEPWGLVVNEAMACGLPVIVSSRSGCAFDLVFPGQNGMIIDPADARSLGDALLVAGDPKWSVAGGQASHRIIQNYTLQTWARSLTDCTLTLLSQQGS